MKSIKLPIYFDFLNANVNANLFFTTLKHFSSYLLIAMDSATHPTFKFEIKSDTVNFFEREREHKSIFDDFETFLNENNVAPHGPVRNITFLTQMEVLQTFAFGKL